MGIIMRYGNSKPQSIVGGLVGDKDGNSESPSSACERRFSSPALSSDLSTAKIHTLNRAKATMEIVDVVIFMEEMKN